MLHERTDEVLSFFNEGTEIGCFGDADELVHRVRYYLEHESERETMRWAAHQRCVREYSVDRMAERIVRRFVEDTCP